MTTTSTVSPVLNSYSKSLRDILLHPNQERLTPLLHPRPGQSPQAVFTGTADHKRDEQRAWMLLDWQIRTFTPAWLNAAGHHKQASSLIALDRIGSPETFAASTPTLAAVVREVSVEIDTRSDGPLLNEVRFALRHAGWKAANLPLRHILGDDNCWLDGYYLSQRAAYTVAQRAVEGAPSGDEQDAWDVLVPIVEELQGSAVDLLVAMTGPGGGVEVAATARCVACGAAGVEVRAADDLMVCVDMDGCFGRQREEFAVSRPELTFSPPLGLVDAPEGSRVGVDGHARRAEDLASRALSVSMRGWWRRGRRRDMLAAATVHAILAAATTEGDPR